MWEQATPELLNGWIDLRMLEHMWVAQGAGVGGGSLIYANISIDAKPKTFDSGWPSEINYAVLKPHYDKVKDMLWLRSAAGRPKLTQRFKLMQEAAGKIGEADRFRKLDLAVTFDNDWNYDLPDPTNPKNSKSWTNRFGKPQGTCVHCGNCDIGCTVQAKNTLDLNYIAAAESAGAVVQPLSLVTHVSPTDGGWRVSYDRLTEGRREPAEEVAKRVVLAAGSLGSSEILLRSRDEYRSISNLSPHLGRGWSSNGDFLTPAFYPGRRIDPTVGPTIACAIDFLDGSQNGARFFVEDGGFPNLLGNFVQAKLKLLSRFDPAAEFWRLLSEAIVPGDPLSEWMPWFGQGVDAANGTFRLARRWYAPWQRYLALDWDVTDSMAAINGLVGMHQKLSQATGGDAVVPFTWTLAHQLITPHPLGGCGMALPVHPTESSTTPGASSTIPVSYYVFDGSIVPRAIEAQPVKKDDRHALGRARCRVVAEGRKQLSMTDETTGISATQGAIIPSEAAGTCRI